jgi:hypothetical protein
MFGGYPRAMRTRDSPAAKGRPLAAGTGALKMLGARRAVLASKPSLQPGELAGGVAQAANRRAVLAFKPSLQPGELAGGLAQATTHVPRIFIVSNRVFAHFSTGQERGGGNKSTTHFRTGPKLS